jgi:hypothetical protein
MASSHGKLTIIKIATKDISLWTKTSTLERGAAVHNITGYGVDDENNVGGLKTGKFTMGGWYDASLTTGTAAVLDTPGATVAVIRQPEGAGTGKPQQSFNAVIEKYTETSPHDEIVSWSCDMTVAGAIVRTTQV